MDENVKEVIVPPRSVDHLTESINWRRIEWIDHRPRNWLQEQVELERCRTPGRTRRSTAIGAVRDSTIDVLP